MRGSCATVYGRALSSTLWLTVAVSSVGLWVEHVRSALNPADPPSRMCPLTDKPVTASGGDLGAHALFRDCLLSKTSLLAAQYALPISDRTFRDPWPCVKGPPPP